MFFWHCIFLILGPSLYPSPIGFDVKIVVKIVVQNCCNCYCIVSKLIFSFQCCVTLVSWFIVCVFRRTYVAYTLFNGNVCNKKWSLDSAVQFIQQSNKSNNGSTCTMGSTCNTRTVIQTMGIVVACMATMMFYPSGSTVNHFYDAYYTSNNHTIRAPNELVVDSGDTTSQAKSNGAMCFIVAISAVCSAFMTGLIQSVHGIGSR